MLFFRIPGRCTEAVCYHFQKQNGPLIDLQYQCQLSGQAPAYKKKILYDRDPYFVPH